MKRSISWGLVAHVALAAALAIQPRVFAEPTRAPGAARRSSERKAAELVQSALKADVAQDTSKRQSLLKQAIGEAPDLGAAQWHLGRVKVDGRWLAFDEAAKHFAADRRLSDYRRLRDELGASAAGNLELARWCRKNRLAEQERAHWNLVLRWQPSNEEAMRGLGVRRFRGALMSTAEIERTQQNEKQAETAAKIWKPLVSDWKKAITAGDEYQKADALAELRKLNELESIPTLEAELSQANAECALEVVGVLGKMRDQRATESLVRHAVLSQFDKVRKQAAAELKHRPLHDFVPMLLDGLVAPIESSYALGRDADGNAHYMHSLFQQGPFADVTLDMSRSSFIYVAPSQLSCDLQTFLVEPGTPWGCTPMPDGTIRHANQTVTDSRPAAILQAPFKVAQEGAGMIEQSRDVERRVAAFNKSAAMLNSRICSALAGSTGQEFGTTPTPWWQWWQEYNETYVPSDRPAYQLNYAEIRRQPLPEASSRYNSCFPRGTLIWTQTGPASVESIKTGDCVLAQDANSGQLAIKPVVATTQRPTGPLLGLRVGGEELRTTLGHPLWVVGKGWRMAKSLQPGQRLHTPGGSAAIESIEPAADEEAYNLIVADFNTYFVGRAAVLAHDVTPQRPTPALVPGLLQP